MVEQYLNMMVEMRKKLNNPPDLKYCCFEEFVLEHGKRYEVMNKPKWVKKGIIKECFKNSFDAVLINPTELTYCEGYATGVIPVHHAWLVYKDKVIDPTWHGRNIINKNTEYFGVEFNWNYVRKVALETGYYGVLDNFTQNFPLLRGEHIPEQFSCGEQLAGCGYPA